MADDHDLTDEEVRVQILMTWHKACRAAAGGSMADLEVCVTAHGPLCDDRACEASWAPA